MGAWLKTEKFISMLKDPNPVLRKNAALLLGEIGAKEAVPALGFALKDGNVKVRKACVEAFSLIRTEESINFLSWRLQTKSLTSGPYQLLSLGRIRW